MAEHDKRQELEQLQRDLSERGLSRREFVTRLKGLGLGFGAAFVLGVREASAATAPHLEPGLGLKSTNPAVDQIIGEGQANSADLQMKAQYYSRIYARYGRYGRYARYARYTRYTRYARVYARYGRIYGITPPYSAY